MNIFRRHRTVAAVAATSFVLLLTSCAATDDKNQTNTGADGKPLTSVTVAFDYLPNNASFAGFYAAIENGIYADAGLDVSIAPYADTTSNVLVNAGQADFGVLDQGNLILSNTTGQNLRSVMAIMQHSAARLATSPTIAETTQSPKDLANKTYGGYGTPIENVLVNAMITADGGNPDFKSVILGNSAYDALTSGQVDMAIPYATDEILWAEMAGAEWQSFKPTDYGFPDSYDKVLFTNEKYLSDHGDVTEAFVSATIAGYEWAAANPAEAIEIQAGMIDGAFDIEQQTATAELLAKEYWPGDTGSVGTQSEATWRAYTEFLASAGVLTDSAGSPLPELPDPTAWFTNEYAQEQP